MIEYTLCRPLLRTWLMSSDLKSLCTSWYYGTTRHLSISLCFCVKDWKKNVKLLLGVIHSYWSQTIRCMP